jgi:hypothetical protein
MSKRTYSELKKLKTFRKRYDYLQLKGFVGESTFGFDRYLNQMLYRSNRWKSLRDEIIIRDEGCDLGIPGYEIYDMIVVHHMNPLTVEDIEEGSDRVFDPNQLICVSHNTHMAIHYGNASLLPQPLIERRPGDMIPWR